MATRITDTIPEYYDEGCLPWPWPEDEVPSRIPVEMMQSPTIQRIMWLLRLWLGLNDRFTDPRLFMDTNIPVRFNPNNRRVFIAPDICIAQDVDLMAIRDKDSYDLWEVGKPPDFALEVASRSTYQNDLYRKPGIYEWIGFEEYWLFDPTGGELYGRALSGFRMVDGRYEPIEITLNEHGLESGYSDFLKLRLCSIDQSRHSELEAIQPDMIFSFRESLYSAQMLLQDPATGLYLSLPDARTVESQREQVARADAKAELDAERAERERVEAENARLRERLRRMGLD